MNLLLNVQFVINMSKSYDRYLQQEAEEYREAEDSATTDGFLEELEEEDDDNFVYRTTGIF